MGDHYNYLLFFVSLNRSLLFYNGKDRSARVCLPEISFAEYEPSFIRHFVAFQGKNVK